MPKLSLLSSFLLLVLGVGSLSSRADEASDAAMNSRLRDALRASLIQLQDAQTQLATAQAAQAQSEKDNADLKTKVAALSTQIDDLNHKSVEDKATADKSIADLNGQITQDNDQITKFNEAIKEWKVAYNQAANIARAKEAARADLAVQVINLQRLVEDRERKNLDLYHTGEEILTRYQDYSLGDALASKEPFLGNERVHLQTLVQDYNDKLLDSKVTIGQPVTTAVPTPKPAPATHPSPSTSNPVAASSLEPAKP